MSDDAIRISPRTPGSAGAGAAHAGDTEVTHRGPRGGGGGGVGGVGGAGHAARRRVHLPVPSELLVLVATVLGVLIAAAFAENFESGQAWSLVTVLAIGYMLARGLAKRGNADDGI